MNVLVDMLLILNELVHKASHTGIPWPQHIFP